MTNLRRPNGDGLSFRYFITPRLPVLMMGHDHVNIPTTEARVDFQGERLVGEAYCSPKDTWNPETGRKVALARALHFIPRDARRPFWTLYFARSARYNRELHRCLAPAILEATRD